MIHPLDELCMFLEWDTNFFGHRIAKVIPNTLTQAEAEAIDHWCLDNDIDCLYLLASSDNMNTVRIAENYHYRQVDVRVIYEHKLDNLVEENNVNSEYHLDIAHVSDIPDILVMMNNSFIHSRFYYDPNFSDEQCNKLYRTWLIRSVEDNLADRVLVMRKDEKAEAVLTCKLDTEMAIGTIGLLSVAESARGQNLALFLSDMALKYFQEMGMMRVEVATQARNISANRLYQKCGFRTKNTYLWYHKWFN